jgi:small subunit ribosomal protein S2
MEIPSVQSLIDAGVHYGCRASRWNPRMKPYIHSKNGAVHVIDLRETLRGIIRAQNLLFQVASEGKVVLWVGTKRQVKGVVIEAGERTGMPVVTERWIGGTLTNFSVIRSRLKRLEQLEAIDEKAIQEQKLNKKELSFMAREQRKITRNLGGIREMKSVPAVMIVVDPSREANAVREARKMGVAVIGILDTDCDPQDVDIVIPGNDDALKSVRLLVNQLAAAVEGGAQQNEEQMKAVTSAEHSDQEPEATPTPAADGSGNEPRPTRPSRPMPTRKEGEAPAPDAVTPEAAAPEAAPAATEAPAPAEAPQNPTPDSSNAS